MGELRNDFDAFHNNEVKETLTELGERDLTQYTLEELENELEKLTADLKSGSGEFMESTQKMKDAPKRIGHLKTEIEKRERIAVAFAKYQEPQDLGDREN